MSLSGTPRPAGGRPELLRRAVGGLLAATALALTGCGVGVQHHASPLDSNAVPFDLLSPAAASPITSTPAVAPAIVYLVSGQRVVPAHREIASTSLAGLLRVLLLGPTGDEVAEGLRSAISSQPRLLSANVSEGLATINLANSFGDIRGSEEVLATAQLVLTATSQDDVNEVIVLLDGSPTELPLVDGTLTSEPLRRGDYVALLGQPVASASGPPPSTSGLPAPTP